MDKYFTTDKLDIYCGDCREVMASLLDSSVDSVVTDPPYELGFMGKKWDNTGIAYDQKMWSEVLRILKPGGHVLSFGGSRTYHRMACAIEDAGFEVRDMVEWMYGSGFPKSLNIGKVMDKQAGRSREIIGTRISAFGDTEVSETNDGRNLWNKPATKEVVLTRGNSEFEGWGTALKPAHEPICLARKPLSEKTVADNVLKWGTGAINIDGCRVPTDESISNHSRGAESAVSKGKYGSSTEQETHQTQGQQSGRFPANLIHDGSDEVMGVFPQSSVTGKRSQGSKNVALSNLGPPLPLTGKGGPKECEYTDSGSAARFFYCAKASQSERNDGVEGVETTIGHNRFDKCATCGGTILQNPDRPSACKCEVPARQDNTVKGNSHPTVKPLSLMRYLVKLITPPNGVVLDPFCGSGTTLIAASDYRAIGIDISAEYCLLSTIRYLKAVS